MYKFKEDLRNEGEIAEQGEQWRPRNVALDLPWRWMLYYYNLAGVLSIFGWENTARAAPFL